METFDDPRGSDSGSRDSVCLLATLTIELHVIQALDCGHRLKRHWTRTNRAVYRTIANMESIWRAVQLRFGRGRTILHLLETEGGLFSTYDSSHIAES